MIIYQSSKKEFVDNALNPHDRNRGIADIIRVEFEKRIGSRIYYVSGYRIRTTGAILLQMIEENAMAQHDHKDIAL